MADYLEKEPWLAKSLHQVAFDHVNCCELFDNGRVQLAWLQSASLEEPGNDVPRRRARSRPKARSVQLLIVPEISDSGADATLRISDGQYSVQALATPGAIQSCLLQETQISLPDLESSCVVITDYFWEVHFPFPGEPRQRQAAYLRINEMSTVHPCHQTLKSPQDLTQCSQYQEAIEAIRQHVSVELENQRRQVCESQDATQCSMGDLLDTPSSPGASGSRGVHSQAPSPERLSCLEDEACHIPRDQQINLNSVNWPPIIEAPLDGETEPLMCAKDLQSDGVPAMPQALSAVAVSMPKSTEIDSMMDNLSASQYQHEGPLWDDSQAHVLLETQLQHAASSLSFTPSPSAEMFDSYVRTPASSGSESYSPPPNPTRETITTVSATATTATHSGQIAEESRAIGDRELTPCPNDDREMQCSDMLSQPILTELVTPNEAPQSSDAARASLHSLIRLPSGSSPGNAVESDWMESASPRPSLKLDFARETSPNIISQLQLYSLQEVVWYPRSPAELRISHKRRVPVRETSSSLRARTPKRVRWSKHAQITDGDGLKEPFAEIVLSPPGRCIEPLDVQFSNEASTQALAAKLDAMPFSDETDGDAGPAPQITLRLSTESQPRPIEDPLAVFCAAGLSSQPVTVLLDSEPESAPSITEPAPIFVADKPKESAPLVRKSAPVHNARRKPTAEPLAIRTVNRDQLRLWFPIDGAPPPPGMQRSQAVVMIPVLRIQTALPSHTKAIIRAKEMPRKDRGALETEFDQRLSPTCQPASPSPRPLGAVSTGKMPLNSDGRSGAVADIRFARTDTNPLLCVYRRRLRTKGSLAN